MMIATKNKIAQADAMNNKDIQKARLQRQM